MFEILSENLNLLILFGTIIGMVTASVAFIYERGKKRGIDTACANRIEEKLEVIKGKIVTETEEADKVHRHLSKEIVTVKVNQANLAGKVDTILKKL